MSLSHIRTNHKYIFIKGNEQHAEEIIRIFEFLGVRNEDNVKCDRKDMWYGIVPRNNPQLPWKHEYKIGEFKNVDMRNDENKTNFEFYRYDWFKRKYIDSFAVGTAVIIKMYGDYNDLRIGKIGLVRMTHDVCDEIEYTVDLSRDNDPAHKLIRVNLKQIVGPYDSIARCMWTPISRGIGYLNHYPIEKDSKHSTTPHTESDDVIVWDSFYGPRIDKRYNGEWLSHRRQRENRTITPDVFHYDVAWMPITPPENAERIR